MAAYEICYLDDDGTLICAFTVQFESAMRAKILAHAMKPPSCLRLEVWHGDEIVYARPELDRIDDMPHMRRHGARPVAASA
jgi:hypothetical protein